MITFGRFAGLYGPPGPQYGRGRSLTEPQHRPRYGSPGDDLSPSQGGEQANAISAGRSPETSHRIRRLTHQQRRQHTQDFENTKSENDITRN